MGTGGGYNSSLLASRIGFCLIRAGKKKVMVRNVEK